MPKPVTKRMVCNTVPTPIRPPSYKVFRGCSIKKQYDTEEQAWTDIRHILRKKADTNSSRPLLPYKCDHCFAWHVGHSNPDATQRALTK